MNLKQLNEGLIDVPDYLIERCERELLKFISTTIVSDRGFDDQLKARKPNVYKEYNVEFRNHGEAYDLNDGGFLAVDVSYDAHDIKYYRDDGSNSSHSVMFGAALNGMAASTHGQTIVKSEDVIIVAVNVSKLFRSLEDELLLDMFVSDSDPIDSPTIQTMIDEDMETVGRMINRFIVKAKGTIKHELEHYLQIRYLSDGEEPQGNIDMDYEDYLISDQEFHPTITSTLYSLTSLKELWPNFSDDKMLLMFNYLIGRSDELGFIIHREDGQEEVQSAIVNRQFFISLKKKKPNKWKKAIKYLYTELKNNGLI